MHYAEGLEQLRERSFFCSLRNVGNNFFCQNRPHSFKLPKIFFRQDENIRRRFEKTFLNELGHKFFAHALDIQPCP